MKEPSKIIKFLKNCYKSDNRELNLFNYYSRKLELPYLLDSVELLDGSVPVFPVETTWGTEVEKLLSIYGKEKDLYLCALFFMGKTKVGTRIQKIKAPILLIPAELVIDEEGYAVRSFPENVVINSSVLGLLTPHIQDNDFVNELYELVAGEPLTFGKCSDIRHFINKKFEHIKTEELLLFPNLYTKEEINQVKVDEADVFSLIPAAGLGIINKPSSSQGVLNELNSLTGTVNYSLPLNEFLGNIKHQPATNYTSATPEIYVPVALSKAQESVFKGIANHAMTLVVGPPGTGKSFTIAAIAADYISQGKSVLIASANNQAVDVIYDKLERDFGIKDIAVRGGGKRNYKKFLKDRIQNILSGIGIIQVPWVEIKNLEAEVHNQVKSIKKLERKFTALEKRELKNGQFLSQFNDGFFHRIRKMLVGWQLKYAQPYWLMLQHYNQKLLKKNEVVKQFVERKFQYHVHETLIYHRSELKDFSNAIKSRTGNRKEIFFEAIDFNILKKTFPVWLVSMAEINSVLPLRKDLFDLVIFDEATQCDLATAIPVMQRAKKVAVFGDPKQLRHVSFLSNSRQDFLGKQLDLPETTVEQFNFRKKSLLDVVVEQVQSQSQVIFLDEHYRSLPGIIKFSNREFYDNKLKVMSSTPINNADQHVYIHYVDGKRTLQGYNKAEADFILSQIKAIIHDELVLEDDFCQSIGVLSPYRNQISYLQGLLEKEINAEAVKRHRILAGTAHSFQGEEKDIMYLTFGIDAETHPSAFQHINRPDVFNVSVTRARSVQHVVTSIRPNLLKQDTLLAKYLHDVVRLENGDHQKREISITIMDEFFEEVKQILLSKGFTKIYQHYPIAGLEMDMVIVDETKTYCINLIGYPGKFEKAFSIERYKILNRVGSPVFPLPFSRWKLDHENTLLALCKYVGK